jgi:hypothetical protein
VQKYANLRNISKIVSSAPAEAVYIHGLLPWLLVCMKQQTNAGLSLLLFLSQVQTELLAEHRASSGMINHVFSMCEWAGPS